VDALRAKDERMAKADGEVVWACEVEPVLPL
jgi:hypothetical protein